MNSLKHLKTLILMVNYQLGKIYKLYCVSDESLFYIGSTAQKTLADILKGHVKDYKRYCNGKFSFVSSFTIIETGNYKIELLESFPCSNRDELTAREGYHMRANPNCVNKNIAGRNMKEWRNENSEKVRGYKKKYREANKDKIKEYKKKYRKANKEKIKQYQDANKEKILKQQKQYREANKEKIKEMKSKKFECRCGSICRRSDKERHFRTKKHQAWVEAQQQDN